ncbi:hypothetical protein NDU88_006544 [Pleurodeles waltl]|uniref:Uncharacterized protein n=1 Tax=Pleurodeles waltl TaxID=8319 RepID=A0AAV7SPT5_PLEWA|nr:hypothetical protein NDU88_006544 [Pleurodeles waltl]
MADILMMGRSKELSKVCAAHIKAALQRQVKTEPVNAVTAVEVKKKKTCPKSATSSKVYVTKSGSGMLLSCCMAEQLHPVTSAFSLHLGSAE